MSPVLSAAIGLLLATAGQVTATDATVVGDVQVSRGTARATVRVVFDKTLGKPHDTTGVVLRGPMADEIQRVATARVEVTGRQTGEYLEVVAYRLAATGLVLVDEARAGSPIALSVRPQAKQHLIDQVGAKIWVTGEQVVSGELRVQRYGVLREGPKKVLEPAATDAKKDAAATAP
jgi:hypothetical protein